MTTSLDTVHAALYRPFHLDVFPHTDNAAFDYHAAAVDDYSADYGSAAAYAVDLAPALIPESSADTAVVADPQLLHMRVADWVGIGYIVADAVVVVDQGMDIVVDRVDRSLHHRTCVL